MHPGCIPGSCISIGGGQGLSSWDGCVLHLHHPRPALGRSPVLVHGGQTRPRLSVLGAQCRSPLGCGTAARAGQTGQSPALI